MYFDNDAGHHDVFNLFTINQDPVVVARGIILRLM